MTYGSPATLEDIPDYLRNIRGGREPDDALVAEFRRRYGLIGGSPLLTITNKQAAALEAELNELADGNSYTVVAGMRFSPPLIADVVRAAAPESGKVVGVIMSPQFSPIIMGGYVRALRDAVAALHRDGSVPEDGRGLAPPALLPRGPRAEGDGGARTACRRRSGTRSPSS